MALLFTLYHSIKANQSSSLNRNALPRRASRRSNTANPYDKRIPFSQVPAPASHASTRSDSTHPSARALASIEAEPSLIVRGILQKTGCSSRQELMAKRAAQAQKANTNGFKSSTNGSMPPAPNGAMVAKNRSKATATNGSKSTDTNRSNSTTNRSNSTTNRSNGTKATNRSTNPKKKTKVSTLLVSSFL